MPTVQMRRTLGELRTLLRQRLGVSESDTHLTSEVLDGFLNAAAKQVSVEHNWPWLLAEQSISVTGGTSTWDVNEDWLATDTVAITSIGAILTNRSKKELLGIPTSTTGQPVYYGVWAEQLNLRPIPDGPYTVTHLYFRMEPTMSGDTAKPLIPQGYDEGLLEFATFLAWRFKEQDQKATLSLQAYTAWLKRTSDNLVEAKEPRAPRVRAGRL